MYKGIQKTWAQLVDYTGTPVVFFVLSGFMVLFFLRKNLFEEALLFTVIFIVTMSLIGLFKIVFRVCRPKDAKIKLRSYAFPSGHTASSTFFVLTSVLLLQGHVVNEILYFIAVVGGLAVITIAASRVVLKVHTLIDVIFGFSIGIIIPLLMLAYF